MNGKIVYNTIIIKMKKSGVKKMIYPTARDIFDQCELSKEHTPELRKYEKELNEKLKKALNDPKAAEEIIDAASMIAAETQFIGFMQGFRVACALFCENT